MRSPTVSRIYLASMFGLGAVALAFACDGTTTTPTPTPVSYTHLDVYKRQIRARAAFGWAFFNE